MGLSPQPVAHWVNRRRTLVLHQYLTCDRNSGCFPNQAADGDPGKSLQWAKTKKRITGSPFLDHHLWEHLPVCFIRFGDRGLLISALIGCAWTISFSLAPLSGQSARGKETDGGRSSCHGGSGSGSTSGLLGGQGKPRCQWLVAFWAVLVSISRFDRLCLFAIGTACSRICTNHVEEIAHGLARNFVHNFQSGGGFNAFSEPNSPLLASCPLRLAMDGNDMGKFQSCRLRQASFHWISPIGSQYIIYNLIHPDLEYLKSGRNFRIAGLWKVLSERRK